MFRKIGFREEKTRDLSLFLLLITTLFLTVASHITQAQSYEPIFAPGFPPGAVVTFPATDFNHDPLPAVFAKSEDDGKIWIANPVIAENPFEPEVPAALGFIVPQLPKGVYLTWFIKKDGTPSDQLRINIIPKLIAREAVVSESPNETVRVQVGINSTFVLEKDVNARKEVRIPVRITGSDKEIAEILTAENSTTDRSGFADWSIRIHKEGVARFTARADGFEPVEIIIVGKAQESPKVEKSEEKLESAKKSLIEVQDQLLIANQELSAQQMEGLHDPTANYQKVLSEQMKIAGKLEEKAIRSERKVSQQILELERLLSTERMKFSTRNLLPGDVLQMEGTTLYISDAIRRFESRQLSISAPYSHSALFLGWINGQPMVAEMLALGYTIQPLSKSVAGATSVSVYRWRQISDQKRAEIVQKAQDICRTRSRFSVCIPYAYEQIAVLALAAQNAPAIVIRTAAASIDLISGGRRKMICSEFVAWIYEDAGLRPQTNRWWSSLESSGILNSPNRLKDYTTPNMLSNSPFQKIARLK